MMNVLVLRFANAIFEAVWSRSYVERVEICCLEEVDCKGAEAISTRTGSFAMLCRIIWRSYWLW